MKLNILRIKKYTFILMFITACLLAFTFISLYNQWEKTEEQEFLIQKELLEIKANQLKNRIDLIYQNIRMIALLPSIKSFAGQNLPSSLETKYEEQFFPETTRMTIQQIYNNLANNIAISEVYGIKYPFYPEKNEKPFFMLDELIISSHNNEDSSELNKEAASKDFPEELEDEEYRWYQSEMKKIQQTSPTLHISELNQYPFAISPTMRTCDNSEYTSVSQGNVNDALGISFAVPIYNNQQQFFGLIVAVLRWNILEQILAEKSNSDYFLRTADRDIYDRKHPSIFSTFQSEQSKFISTQIILPNHEKWILYKEINSNNVRSGLIQMIALTLNCVMIFALLIIFVVSIEKKLNGTISRLLNVSTTIGSAIQGMKDKGQSLNSSFKQQLNLSDKISSEVKTLTNLTHQNIENAKNTVSSAKANLLLAQDGVHSTTKILEQINR